MIYEHDSWDVSIPAGQDTLVYVKTSRYPADDDWWRVVAEADMEMF
jgi:hypothetical protein